MSCSFLRVKPVPVAPFLLSTDMWPMQAAVTGGRDAALKALVMDQGFAEPEEIAAAVVFLASPDAWRVTGVDLRVDDGVGIT